MVAVDLDLFSLCDRDFPWQAGLRSDDVPPQLGGLQEQVEVVFQQGLHLQGRMEQPQEQHSACSWHFCDCWSC